MNKIDYYISRVPHLPPAPTIATRLLDLFSDPKCDIDQIVELISLDPSLTAEILKRCNSVFFQGQDSASDMYEAVTRLGFYEVYTVVAALIGARTLSLVQAGGSLDTGELWRHSVIAAVAAATLARGVREPEAVAFTAGLLHDVGKLVFASVEGDTYAKLMRKAGTSGPALVEAEEQTLEAIHPAVGARLLAHWGLSSNVALAVLHHHHQVSATAPFQNLGAILQLANALAHDTTEQATVAPDLAVTAHDAMSQLHLTSEDVPTLAQEIESDLERLQGLLQITP